MTLLEGIALGGKLTLSGLLWVKNRLAVCTVSIGSEWVGGTFEDAVKWIHIPVTVKANWCGSFPIVDAEVDIIESSIGSTPLFWQNENDSDKPERKMTLRPGSYLVPFAARTTRPNFALSGRASTLIPSNLYQAWLLKRGVVRITNGAHYFTFVNYLELSKQDLYKFRVAIRNQAGKVVAEREFLVAVPEVDADNKFFYLT